ncbi:MAG: ribonuclease HI [Bergeyella sp.]|nr:ribonuclease HI [Bergeyella sp.]
MRVDIYTDGACSGNPGKGGYGILMKVAEKGLEKKISEGYRKTTNNRMELLAVIVALENMKNGSHEIHIYTDSRYVSNAITKKWLYGWKEKGFSKIKNPDLWKRLFPLLEKYQPQFHWVKGHNGHPENEIADWLAVKATKNALLKADTFYEKQDKNSLL